MSRTPFSPIAVFAYKRTQHLSQTLDALEACAGFNESPIFVFSDGPKSDADREQVERVRALLRLRRRPNMTLLTADSNKGLAGSIIDGVTRLCAEYERVIVIEDDVVLQPPALQWFNAGLDKFQDCEAVAQVTAYQFRVPEFRDRKSGVLLPFTSSWGWGTWRRAWKAFDPAVLGWQRLLEDRAFRRAFNLGDAFPMADYLLAQREGRHDSWATRWYWACFKAGRRTLFPPTSLVRNIGFDATATHGRAGIVRRLLRQPESFMWASADPPTLPAMPTSAADDEAFRRALRRTGAMRNASIRSALRHVAVRLRP